ncbi:MAG: DUF1501 domain-containing protein [Planctomycetes bacterium]|nr:DUF1501 domain-containing protein [Planctomycetota bacterium]
MTNQPVTTPFSRRRLLHAGASAWMTSSVLRILHGGAAQAASTTPSSTSASDLQASFGRAKSVIYLNLSGGPSQYETLDPKPDAPAEIRGIFSPIATNVAGTQICELLPRTATMADRLAIVRSFATDDPNHESAGYWINTGHKYAGPDMRALAPTDWPTLGAIVKMLKPTERGPFSAVMLPEPIIANPNVFLPGQNAGFLGRRWDPDILKCDPSATDFRIESLTLPEQITVSRMESRGSLLAALNVAAPIRTPLTADHTRLCQDALGVLVSGTAQGAFAIDKEPPELRERYGRGKWGQSVLLARRLIEAGVRMVFVQWPREPGDLSAPNPLWDTHANNNVRMKDILCPQFDLGFTALIEDLEARGLLDETLVVAVGEMGRTPTFNASGGRDHWGNVFSFALAGAGVRAGQVYGASDRNGAYPARDRVTPAQLTATILHLLGVSHEATFPDRTGRPLRVVEGEPIAALI